MDTMVLLARLILAAAFLTAGAAKLADRITFRQTLGDFGLPQRLVAPLHMALPFVELAVALTLLGAYSFWWAAVAALALLAVFMVGIAINLRKGRAPECHCFGQLGAGVISWRTLFRNALLATLSALIVWRGPGQAGPGVLEGLWAVSGLPLGIIPPTIVALLLFAIQGWFIVHLLRQNGRLLLRLEALEARLDTVGLPAVYPPPAPLENGLTVGSQAPTFTLPLADGSETISLAILLAEGRPLILLFVDPNCRPCRHLRPEIERWQQAHATRLTIAVFSRVNKDANGTMAEWAAVQNLLLQQGSEVADAYHVRGTPSAILLDSNGTIAAPTVAGADAIRRLVQRAVQEVVLESTARELIATRL